MSSCGIRQALCAVVVTLFVGIAAGQCLTKQQFSSYRDNHQYSLANVQKDWSSPAGPYKMIAGGSGPALTRIDNGAIRGSFRKGQIKGYNTGFTWYSKHARGYNEVSMAYRVKFSANFDWTKGGKLPGMCGGEGRGTVCPAGCSSVGRDRGFSMRLMWRQNGGAVTYAYYPDKPKSIRCGEDWKWSQGFKANKWHHIRMWAKLNTGSNKNGEFKAWLDGKQVLHRKNIRYRYNSKFQISRSYITTYAGGSTVKQFAPNKNQYIWFDDFETWVGGGSSPCGLKNKSPSRPPPRNPPPRNPPPSRPPPTNPPARNPPPQDECPTGCIAAPTPPASAKSPPASVRPRGVGTQRAPKDISGYVLVLDEAGWDVPGNIGRKQAPRGSLLNAIKFCLRGCDDKQNCAGFGLHDGVCWLKDENMFRQTYEWHGETSTGWRWLYRSRAKTDPQVVDQTATEDQPATPEESETLDFNPFTLLDGGACGGISPPMDEFKCDWVISAQWPEAVDGQRLKMWGLELLDQQKTGATFRRLSGDMGMCVYWQDFDGSVNPEATSQWLHLSATCPE
eukprot:jgi/Ulvmu1/9037/UM005_0129.1